MNNDVRSWGASRVCASIHPSLLCRPACGYIVSFPTILLRHSTDGLVKVTGLQIDVTRCFTVGCVDV